ncbi:MAG: DinB family protein [Crocinitomicaceae bacterium]
MSLPSSLAKNYRDLHFGGNWTVTNLKEVLSEINFETAQTKIEGFNTIAALTFHIHYFTKVTLEVLEGKPLNAHDKYSYDVPNFNNEQEWRGFLNQYWTEAKRFADLVEALDDNQLFEVFSEEKYGNYYRNISGIIEHGHYHLGQIVILNKMIIQKKI